MPRIKPLDPSKVQGPAREMLDAIQRKMGKVPAIFRTLAHSPAALGSYLGQSEALSHAKLPVAVREQVALALAQDNRCDYCVAAHTFLGKGAGLTDEEMLGARRGKGTDPLAAAAVGLALKLSRTRGDVTDADVAQARKGGLDDAELSEVVAVTALNLYTNWFNHVAGTEPDFPPVPKL